MTSLSERPLESFNDVIENMCNFFFEANQSLTHTLLTGDSKHRKYVIINYNEGTFLPSFVSLRTFASSKDDIKRLYRTFVKMEKLNPELFEDDYVFECFKINVNKYYNNFDIHFRDHKIALEENKSNVENSRKESKEKTIVKKLKFNEKLKSIFYIDTNNLISFSPSNGENNSINELGLSTLFQLAIKIKLYPYYEEIYRRDYLAAYKEKLDKKEINMQKIEAIIVRDAHRNTERMSISIAGNYHYFLCNVIKNIEKLIDQTKKIKDPAPIDFEQHRKNFYGSFIESLHKYLVQDSMQPEILPIDAKVEEEIIGILNESDQNDALLSLFNKVLEASVLT
ncbi:MAG: hypothetical protein H0W88_07895 [Parachlamydiaceae bacterium]|nr:hypothetical protein [Parachlamydiaceae bacterium]